MKKALEKYENECSFINPGHTTEYSVRLKSKIFHLQNTHLAEYQNTMFFKKYFLNPCVISIFNCKLISRIIKKDNAFIHIY